MILAASSIQAASGSNVYYSPRKATRTLTLLKKNMKNVSKYDFFPEDFLRSGLIHHCKIRDKFSGSEATRFFFF